MIRILLAMLITLSIATVALGDIINGKYGEAQVFDTKRSSGCDNGGPTCDIWGLSSPYVGSWTNGNRVNWSTNDYLSFVLISGTNYRLVQYYDNGTQKEVVQNGGSIYALGSGIVYLGSEGRSTGYFISNSVGIDSSSQYTSSSPLELTSTNADFDVTAADLASYPATTSILAAGVSAPNVAPIADNVTENVTDNGTHNLSLGGYDANGDNVTYTIVSTPSHGVFVLTDNQTGAFTFQPYDNLSAAQVLQDNLTFFITDNSSENSTIYTYSFTINGVNNPPTADNKSFPASGSITAPNLYTDNLSGADFHGDNFTFVIATQPVYGNVTIVDNITGTFSYDPKGVPVGTFIDNFTYVTRDNYSDDSEPAYVLLSVVGVNDPPEADNVSNNITDNSSNNLSLGGGDPDGDNVTYTIVSTPSHGVFVLTDNRTGAFTFEPYDNLSAGQVLQDNLTFQITDNNSTTSGIYTYSFTITGENNPPTADNKSFPTGGGSITAPNLYTDNLSGADFHGDNFTFIIATQPVYGNVTIVDNITGTFSYDPKGVPVGTFIDNFTYVTRDNYSDDSEPAYVSLTVTGVNDPPEADNVSNNLTDNGTNNLTLGGGDPDGDNVTYTILSTPSYGVFVLTDNQTGAFTFQPYDNLSAGNVVQDNLTFFISDNSSTNSTIYTYSFTITGQNDVPEAFDSLTSDNFSDNGSVSFQLQGRDNDSSMDLTYVLVSDAQYGTTSLDNQTGLVTFTPYDNLSAGFFASDNVTFYVTDNLSNSSIQTYSFNVLGSNDVPFLDNLSGSATEGGSGNFTLVGFDADGDSITAITVLNTPNYGNYSLGTLTEIVPGNSTILLTYTPYDNLSAQTYTETINYQATDNQSENSTVGTISLTVTGQNDLPTAQDNLTTDNYSDSGSFSLQLSGSDPDADDNLTYVLVSDAQYGTTSLDNQTGVLTFTPYDNLSAGFFATDNVTFYVTDNLNNSTIQTFSFNVLGSNDAPGTGQPTTDNYSDSGSFSLQLSGSDPDANDNLTYVLGRMHNTARRAFRITRR